METVFSNIAQAIRDRFKPGTTSATFPITPLQFPYKIHDINSTAKLELYPNDTLETCLENILSSTAVAIKERSRDYTIMTPKNMPDRIRSIPNGTWTDGLTASTTLKFDNFTISNGNYTFKYSNYIGNVINIPSGAEITLIYGSGVNISTTSNNYFTASSQTTVPQSVIDMFGGVDNYLNEEGYFTLNVKYSYWV